MAYVLEEIEDIKEVIRGRRSKKRLKISRGNQRSHV
jgi:hypothetical protein